MFSLPVILGRLALASLNKEKLISDRYSALPYKDQIYGFVKYKFFIRVWYGYYLKNVINE